MRGIYDGSYDGWLTVGAGSLGGEVCCSVDFFIAPHIRGGDNDPVHTSHPEHCIVSMAEYALCPLTTWPVVASSGTPAFRMHAARDFIQANDTPRPDVDTSSDEASLCPPPSPCVCLLLGLLESDKGAVSLLEIRRPSAATACIQ